MTFKVYTLHTFLLLSVVSLKHLNSDRHQSFARDSSNYRSLDELINKGPSLQDFLAKMLLKHEQKEKENQEKNR